jgi:hypothetical protein
VNLLGRRTITINKPQEACRRCGEEDHRRDGVRGDHCNLPRADLLVYALCLGILSKILLERMQHC